MSHPLVNLVQLVSDEVSTLRDLVESIGLSPATAEASIDRIMVSNPEMGKKLLAQLHAAFHNVNFQFASDDHRHQVFTIVFGRQIRTAKQVTNLEAIAIMKIASNPASAKIMAEAVNLIGW